MIIKPCCYDFLIKELSNKLIGIIVCLNGVKFLHIRSHEIMFYSLVQYNNYVRGTDIVRVISGCFCDMWFVYFDYTILI